MKNIFSKKLPTLVSAAIISLVIGTTYAAWNDHKGPGSPILSADWNAMVAEINSKISSFTETDPKVGSLSVSYFPKWSSANTALVNSSLYESADTKLVAKGVDQGVSNYVANFIDSLSNSLLLVRNDGNVGIGTTTPSAKLEVNGNIIAADPTATNHLATKNYVDLKAPLASPAFIGIPTAPTAAINTSTTQLATTKFVVDQVVQAAGGSSICYWDYEGSCASGFTSMKTATYGSCGVACSTGPMFYALKPGEACASFWLSGCSTASKLVAGTAALCCK